MYLLLYWIYYYTVSTIILYLPLYLLRYLLLYCIYYYTGSTTGSTIILDLLLYCIYYYNVSTIILDLLLYCIYYYTVSTNILYLPLYLLRYLLLYCIYYYTVSTIILYLLLYCIYITPSTLSLSSAQHLPFFTSPLHSWADVLCFAPPPPLLPPPLPAREIIVCVFVCVREKEKQRGSCMVCSSRVFMPASVKRVCFFTSTFFVP